MIVTWYTWFIALNYGVLGWMAANTSSTQHPIICIIALVFITHGVVGLCVIHYIHKYYKAEFEDAVDMSERRVARMYVVGIYGISITYATMVVVWVVVPFIWPDAVPPANAG